MHRIREIDTGFIDVTTETVVEATKRAMEKATRGEQKFSKAFSREDYARGEKEIKKLVAEGKVSKEDAERRLGEMRRAMGSGQRGKGAKGVEPRFIPEEELQPRLRRAPEAGLGRQNQPGRGGAEDR